MTWDINDQAAKLPWVPEHEGYIRRCIGLALRAEGRTLPNPLVGALLVRHGTVVAEGWHQGPGQPHAEIVALRSLSGSAADSTLYVNLEPCCHDGRTPPCTD